MMLGIGALPNPECLRYGTGAERPWWCGPSELVSDIYCWFQYGSTPAPSMPATPSAPATVEAMTVPGAFTPADAAAGATPQQTALLTQQAIRDAEASGTYNPAGLLPVNASGEVNWVSLALVGAAVIGALLLTRR